MNIQITLARLEELLKAAYKDGLEDGVIDGGGNDPDYQWAESVTNDQFDALSHRVRDGKAP